MSEKYTEYLNDKGLARYDSNIKEYLQGKLATKADSQNVYDKTEIDGKVSTINSQISSKVSQATYNDKMSSLDAKNTSQDASIASKVSQADYNTKMTALDSKNTSQDTLIGQKANITDVYTKQEVENLIPTNYVTTNTEQSISAPKTITSTSVVFTTVRKNNNAGIYAGLMMKRELASGTAPPNICGIGGYFKARNTSDEETHAGLFGGRLTPAVEGESPKQVGEVVFSPAWENADPYQRADFRIRATGPSTANTYLTGSMYVNAGTSGKGGDKVATTADIQAAIISSWEVPV